MTFQRRLIRVMATGNMTLADLSRWFGRPFPTVRGWVKHGRLPGLAPMDNDRIYTLLDTLEKRIKAEQGFPIPKMSQDRRITYLNSIIEAVTA